MGSMIEDTSTRLEDVGYTIIAADTGLIERSISAVEREIMTKCNTAVVPDGLHAVAVDKAAGEFLRIKSLVGALTGFDASPAVKSISEGDTRVEYAVSEGSGLDRLLLMLSHPDTDYGSYRRLSW